MASVNTASRGRVLSVNVGRSVPSTATSAPGGTTGIDKRPVERLQVRAPGTGAADLGSGVVGDHIGDRRHHGGDEKAVFMVSREELDHWSQTLGRDLRSGMFGENLTTIEVDVDAIVLGSRLVIGEVVLRATRPRTPCRTFAAHMGEQGWVKRYTQRGSPGLYCAVEAPGEITAGTPIVLEDVPDHGVDNRQAFAALTGDREAARAVVAAGVLSEQKREVLQRWQ